MQVHNESLNDRYLGMPMDVGHSKKGTFKYLSDRVWDKVKGWMSKCLSSGGKEVLIKSVAQAIPVFSMSCFKLPRGLCDHIKSIIRKFWWGCKQGERKSAWVSWKVMTRPKYLGGLGFRDLELLNLALLARQAWRLLQEPSSLSARILKASYFPTSSSLTVELGSRPSQVWRAICAGTEVLKQGIVRRIGNGQQTSIWNQNWIRRDYMLRALHPRSQNPLDKVSELINPSERQWDRVILREQLQERDVNAILNIEGNFWYVGTYAPYMGFFLVIQQKVKNS